MSDENKIDIDNILTMLNSPDIADTLKDVMSSLSADNENVSNSNDISNMLSSIINSNSSSSTTNLLHALKPYLNEKRQKKIDQCEKFMTFANAFQIMNKLNNDSD